MSLFSATPVSPLSRDLLDRYLAGRASRDEIVQVEAWLAEEEGRAVVVSALRAWPVDAGDIEQQLLAVKRDHHDAPQRRRTVRSRRWAPLLGMFVVGLLAIVGVMSRPISVTQEQHTYRTALGERATLQLSPGTHALLGPATTLVVGRDARGTLALGLSGEALFTVNHDPRTSLTIHTGPTDIRVLGTTFFVHRYADDHITRVGVSEGRVAVRDVVVPANTVASVADSGVVVMNANVAVQDYTRWTAGQLVFRDMQVHDIVAELARAYDAEIRVPDQALRNESMSLTVPVARWSLDQALALLVAPLDAHYTRSGRVVTISAGRATQDSPVRRMFPSSPESQYGK